MKELVINAQLTERDEFKTFRRMIEANTFFAFSTLAVIAFGVSRFHAKGIKSQFGRQMILDMVKNAPVAPEFRKLKHLFNGLVESGILKKAGKDAYAFRLMYDDGFEPFAMVDLENDSSVREASEKELAILLGLGPDEGDW